jgi:hypothetical protein
MLLRDFFVAYEKTEDKIAKGQGKIALFPRSFREAPQAILQV